MYIYIYIIFLTNKYHKTNKFSIAMSRKTVQRTSLYILTNAELQIS